VIQPYLRGLPLARAGGELLYSLSPGPRLLLLPSPSKSLLPPSSVEPKPLVRISCNRLILTNSANSGIASSLDATRAKFLPTKQLDFPLAVP